MDQVCSQNTIFGTSGRENYHPIFASFLGLVTQQSHKRKTGGTHSHGLEARQLASRSQQDVLPPKVLVTILASLSFWWLLGVPAIPWTVSVFPFFASVIWPSSILYHFHSPDHTDKTPVR